MVIEKGFRMIPSWPLCRKEATMFRKRHGPPGSSPGTLAINDKAKKPVLKVIDYGPEHFEERELAAPGDIAPYMEKDSVTWLDVQGLGDEAVLRALGEIFSIHPLALEDVVNVPQRPKAEQYNGKVA